MKQLIILSIIIILSVGCSSHTKPRPMDLTTGEMYTNASSEKKLYLEELEKKKNKKPFIAEGRLERNLKHLNTFWIKRLLMKHGN